MIRRAEILYCVDCIERVGHEVRAEYVQEKSRSSIAADSQQ